MKTVMTVCGAVEVNSLGFCQCHEHLAISSGASGKGEPALIIDDEEKSLQEALRLKRSGGGTVVDAQPGGCGRMEGILQRISQQSHLSVIASAGFHKLYFYPENHWLFRKTGREIYKIFLHELTEGMYEGIDREFCPENTAIRAGIVKMALDREGLTPVYRKLFRAGVRAAMEADVPAMVHIEKGSDPVELFRFLNRLGLPPGRMIFCHMDRAVEDLSVHRELLRKGVYLEYDTIGRFKYHSDEREIEIFSHMINAGCGERLLFSLDTTRARLKAYTPNAIGLDYLLTDFVPLMIKHGITREQINKISNANFIRVFTE